MKLGTFYNKQKEKILSLSLQQLKKQIFAFKSGVFWFGLWFVGFFFLEE